MTHYTRVPDEGGPAYRRYLALAFILGCPSPKKVQLACIEDPRRLLLSLRGSREVPINLRLKHVFGF